MFPTVPLAGSFTGTGNAIDLNIVSDFDWIEVRNFTNSGATGDDGVRFFWQRGMPNGGGIREFKSGGGNNLNLATLADPNGFTPLDTTTDPMTAPIAITAATNAVQPVVSTANTGALVAGDVVVLSGTTGAPTISGIPFAVDTVVANTSFMIKNALANAPGAAATAGFWRQVRWPAYWFPQRRLIADITQANPAVVTLTADIPAVNPNFVVGQRVRFNIPASYGMTQLDGLDATITALTASTITVNVDTTTFSAFTFPVVADAPNSYAHVWAYGQTASTPYENLLDDAVENVGFRGVRLGGGAQNPGGGNGDAMYWIAGKAANL